MKKIRAFIARYEYNIKKKILVLYGEEKYYQIYKTEKKKLMSTSTIAVLILGLCMLIKEHEIWILLLGSVFPILLGFLKDKELDNKIEERKQQLRFEFPEFVNKLVLLVNAGMTINRAWEKIAIENKKNTPLYNEIRKAYINMKNGKTDIYAIEQFGRNCNVKEIVKFSSILTANIRKGGAEMVPILIQQADESWALRKAAAQEIGAKAGVKMMLPMVMLLLAMILVVGTPAVMMMNQI